MDAVAVGASPDYGGLAPIAPPTRLYEVVTQAIVDHIERAGLVPGDSLPSERALAQRLKVSRSSVRQALTELRVTGVIDIRHGDGAYLRRPVHDGAEPIEHKLGAGDPEYLPLVEARMAIEPAVVRLAAERRTVDDLQALRAAIEQMREDVRNGGIGIGGNRSFHAAVARASHSAVLCDVVASLELRLPSLWYASLSRPRQAELSLDAHEQIFAAIERSSPDDAAAAAELLMRAHVGVIGGDAGDAASR